MKRMRDFRCDLGHLFERVVDDHVHSLDCVICGAAATRVISPTRSKLEGITGAFPDAYDRWARVHEEAARVANKKWREHNVE